MEGSTNLTPKLERKEPEKELLNNLILLRPRQLANITIFSIEPETKFQSYRTSKGQLLNPKLNSA
jgi:hypothetical protein